MINRIPLRNADAIQIIEREINIVCDQTKHK